MEMTCNLELVDANIIFLKKKSDVFEGVVFVRVPIAHKIGHRFTDLGHPYSELSFGVVSRWRLRWRLS